jgi:hypothetical protein
MTAFNINRRNTSLEVWVKIMNSTAKKYNCSMKVNYKNGNGEVVFRGDESMKPFIAAEVVENFPGLSD